MAAAKQPRLLCTFATLMLALGSYVSFPRASAQNSPGAWGASKAAAAAAMDRSESSGTLQPCGSRCRRSSASVNMGCPGLPFPLSPVRTHCHHGITSFNQQADHAGTQLGHADQSSIGTGFELPSLATLKRKGGVEADSPPNKLFVAGIFEHTSLDLPSVSSSEMCTDSGQVLVGSSTSTEFSPSPRSLDKATVILSASPPTRFNLPSSNFSGL